MLDLSMPGYSGVEVCQTLATLSFTRNIPIIIITGASSAQYKEFCENIGAKAFFQKPIDVDGLKKALNDLVQGRSREPQVEQRRVHLRVGLTLKGMDSRGKPFNLAVTTENVGTGDFFAACSEPLPIGAGVEVALTQNPAKVIGKARVTRVEFPGTPSQRCDFHFVKPPSEWILK